MNPIRENYKHIINESPLFENITSGEIGSLLKYNTANLHNYDRNEYILAAGDHVKYFGIVISGSIHVIQEDYWGNRRILAYFNKGSLFGEAFSCAEAEFLPVSVVAAEKTTVLLIDYNKLLNDASSKRNAHADVSHSRATLIKNMLKIMAEKNVILTQKMNILTNPSTREKIMAYLSSQAILAGKNKFKIPFNRQELADYLSVNRSAMSRELSAMIDEGLIKTSRSTFELLI